MSNTNKFKGLEYIRRERKKPTNYSFSSSASGIFVYPNSPPIITITSLASSGSTLVPCNISVSSSTSTSSTGHKYTNIENKKDPIILDCYYNFRLDSSNKTFTNSYSPTLTVNVTSDTVESILPAGCKGVTLQKEWEF